MPRGAPESRGNVPRAKSSPLTSSNNTVVSRSSIPRQRKGPPRRGGSGSGSIPEVKASAIAKTPMSNRQRLATRAALEMSMSMSMDGIDLLGGELEDDEESLKSNVSTGSEELKAPSSEQQNRRNRSTSRGEEMSSTDSRRRRSSSQKASTARQHRDRSRRERKQSIDGSEERPERPSSVASLDDGDKPHTAPSTTSLTSTGSRSSTTSSRKSDDSSNRGERRSAERQSSRQRSSSRKRGERSKRSSSLHEKRNRRINHMSNWKTIDAPDGSSSKGRISQVPKSSGSLHRQKVTEKEILKLLEDDYEMPLSNADSKDDMDKKFSSSMSNMSDFVSSRSQRRSRTAGKPPASSSSKSPSKYEDRSPSTERSLRSSRTASDTRALRGDRGNISQSAHKTPPGRTASSSSSSSTTRTPRVRRTPQRSKSDSSDHGLDSFLQQNVSVSRRKKATSGSRSVASMPASAKARRRRVSISEKSDGAGDATKPSSVPYIDDDEDPADHQEKKRSSSRSATTATAENTENDDEYHDDIEDDAASTASMDLDLATAKSFQQQTFHQKLQLHLSKTDNLLYSVFPKHVADALRNGQKVEPENHDLVTIFFSDIVGFTDISSQLDPIKISDMLDRLYHSFDALSDYHDVFKVETIGDAYMAVTNLAKKQPDHAKRIAEFSIDAIRVANQTLIDEDNPSLGFVNIRVGFHSGPVVSNVVGTRNPRYCLFGDTVNTSSRMESNSQINRIHCSEAAATLLRDQCPKIRIFPRGTIEVKGKGEMKTFWVHTEGSVEAKASGSGEKKQNIFNNVFGSLRREKVST